MTASDDILDRVVKFYLESRDFNGLPVLGYEWKVDEKSTVRELVESDLLQVVSERDYPNPHIRPWPSRRSKEEQVTDFLACIEREAPHACLYPTTEAMTGRIAGKFEDQPYRRRLAAGDGALELAFFGLDVLEPYRNDPRYHFRIADFEADFGIGDDSYLDESEPKRDKIASVRAGFAYDPDTLDDPYVRRYLCAFLCDLADMTPEHQRRWETYEEHDSAKLQPHPVWWAMMMGHWPDGIGTFDKIRHEMAAINELCELIHGEKLFELTERPRRWGWVLRPSTPEWEQFILLTDKMLSENLRHSFFDLAGVDRELNGTRIGTIKRLELLLASQTTLSNEEIASVLKPLRDVRAARQKPAHVVTQELTDKTVTSMQRDLLSDIAWVLHSLRKLLMTHPKAGDWKPKDWLDGKWYRL